MRTKRQGSMRNEFYMFFQKRDIDISQMWHSRIEKKKKKVHVLVEAQQYCSADVPNFQPGLVSEVCLCERL